MLATPISFGLCTQDMDRRKIIALSFAVLLPTTAHSLALAQPARIHISAPSKSLSWFPIHLAREKGFYAAEGLDVDSSL